MVFWDFRESKDFYVYKFFFPFCVESSYVTFVGWLLNLKKPLRSGVSLSKKRIALQFRCKAKNFSVKGL